MATVCLGDSLPQSFSTSNSHNLSPLASAVFPEPWRRVLVATQMSHLGASTPFSVLSPVVFIDNPLQEEASLMKAECFANLY